MMDATDYEILMLAKGREEIYFRALESIHAKIMTLDPQAASIGSDEEEQSRLLSIADTVGVITVKGALVNTDSYWNRYFGAVSYNEIREATIQALDAGVGAILYDYGTPGGTVDGLADTADFISNLDVPTFTFTSAQMASAGYFLGSQSDHVYADSFADVGSIGVLIKMFDRSEQYKKAGIKPIRFRSGNLKATGDSAFKLTTEEKKYIQEKVTVLSDKFFGIVSDARGLTLGQMEKAGITSGRTYIGEQSVDAGLVDKLRSFDQTMQEAYTAAAKTIDKRDNRGIRYSS